MRNAKQSPKVPELWRDLRCPNPGDAGNGAALNGVYRLQRTSPERCRLSESAWVQRARRGDEAAWEALVRHHQDGVFRFAYLHLGDAAEAEDVAQETFLRAFRALERFDIQRPMRPWLLSIAANLARNRRRSLGRAWAALQRAVQREPEGVGLQPEHPGAETDSWRGQLLWQAMQGLSPTDRELLYLRYFMDLSIAEAAEATGVASGTVKSRTHRALERLRQVIVAEYPELDQEQIA